MADLVQRRSGVAHDAGRGGVVPPDLLAVNVYLDQGLGGMKARVPGVGHLLAQAASDHHQHIHVAGSEISLCLRRPGKTKHTKRQNMVLGKTALGFG